MDFENKLSLYFFNPNRNEEEYSSSYRKITGEKIVAYSPLYILRRHILFMSGQLPENTKYKPYFSALILSNIAINGLLELLGYEKRENDFYIKYLGKNPQQVLGLKILRNTLEHNNFMLFTRLVESNRKTGYYFRALFNYFKSKNEIGNDERKWLKYFKVAFSLYESLGGVIVSLPMIEGRCQDKHYILARYKVAPFDYLRRFERMFENIKLDILNNKDLRERFDKTITTDNWMRVY